MGSSSRQCVFKNASNSKGSQMQNMGKQALVHEIYSQPQGQAATQLAALTKLGAGASLIGTKMVIMAKKKRKSQYHAPASLLSRLSLTYRLETMRSFEAWKETSPRKMQTPSLAGELMKHKQALQQGCPFVIPPTKRHC